MSSSNRWTPGLLSREDAAEYLSVSPRQFSDLIAMGKVKGVKFFANSIPKYKLADLDALIESMEYGQGRDPRTAKPERAKPAPKTKSAAKGKSCKP